MIKEKRKVLTLLAAAALAVSVPGNSADVQASSNTFRVNVATGYLALRNDTSLIPAMRSENFTPAIW